MAFQKQDGSALNFDGLVSAMKGKDSLSDWDVLVSYDEAQINALLASEAQKLGLQSPFTFEAIDKDPWDDNEETISFNVTLLAPTMRFIDTSKNVTVTAGMTGQFQSKSIEKHKGEIPSGTTVTISTSLVNVEGQYNDEWFWTPNDDPEPPGSDYVVILPNDKKISRGVCINFKDCKAVLQVPEGSGGHLNALMTSHIEEHFTKHGGLRLCLAAVSNEFDPNDDSSVVLRPTSFCFTLMPGVLMTWIGVQGGANGGTRPSGQTDLTFAPDSRSISPLPDGRTASVIFSHYVMATLFFKPLLLASPAVDKSKPVSTKPTKGSDGMNFEFTFGSYPLHIDPLDYSSLYIGRHVDGADINVNSATSSLTVSAGRVTKSNNAIEITWQNDWDKKTFWSHVSSIQGGSGTDGSFYARFTLHGRGCWSASPDPAHHPNELGISFDIDKDFIVETKVDDQTSWDKFFGHSNSVPTNWQDLSAKVPDKIALSGRFLDYFLTTNLLLPGENVFIADKPVPDDDATQAGIATPRDTIITGSVAKSKVLSLRRMAAKKVAVETSPQLLSISNGVSQTQPTLDDLKEALMSFPENDLLGQILAQTGSDIASPTPQLGDLLRKFGFGNLVGAEFLALYGTTLAEVTGTISMGNLPSTKAVQSLDLRLYGSTYVATKPEQMAGGWFSVEFSSGLIRVGSKVLTPQQLYNNERQKVMVTWTSPSGTVYRVYFGLTWNAASSMMGIRCEGTIQERAGIEQPYEAFDSTFLSDTDTNVHFTGLPSIQAEPWTRFITRFQSFKQIWLLYDRPDISARLHEIAVDARRELAKGIAEQVADQLKEELGRHHGLVEDEARKMEDQVREIVARWIDLWIKNNPLFVGKLRDAPDEPELRRTIDLWVKTARSQIDYLRERAIREINRVVIPDLIAKAPGGQSLTNHEMIDMTEHINIARIESVKNQQENPRDGSEPYAQNIGMAELNKRSSDANNELVEETNKNLGELNDRETKTDEEIKQQEAEIEKEMEERKRENDPEVKKEIDKVLERLERTRNETKKRAEDLQERIRKLGQETEEAGKRINEMLERLEIRRRQNETHREAFGK